MQNAQVGLEVGCTVERGFLLSTFNPSCCPGRPVKADPSLCPLTTQLGKGGEKSYSVPCLIFLTLLPQMVIRVASCSLGTLFPGRSSGSPLASDLLTPCKNNFPF